MSSKKKPAHLNEHTKLKIDFLKILASFDWFFLFFIIIFF